MHALLPRLSEQQRAEMAELRQIAVERVCERNTVRLVSLLDRVQDVNKHVQLRKVQHDEKDVNQTVEAAWSKRTLEEQQYTSPLLNSTAQWKETQLLPNSQPEKMGKRKEEKGEEIQPSCIREIQLGIENLGYVEMQNGKKKPNSCQKLISVSVNQSEVHLQNFNETFKNSNRGVINSTKQSGLSASSGVDWNCSFSDQTKTSVNLITSSTPRSLTSRSPITKLNTTQPEIFIKKESQRNHSATHQRVPPAPLNRSYDVESPSQTPLRPRIRSGSEASETFFRHNLEPGTHPYHSTNQEDVAAVDVLQVKIVGHIQLLETSCKHLKDRNTLQLSDVYKIKGQETQQQEQQKAACLLTAAARGFLTRRLLQTEKIKHMNKTIQDSRQVIHDFQADAHQRKASFTIQNLKLQQQVRAQLRAAVCEVHEIFFVWPVRDRIALLQQARKLHSERRVEKKGETQDRDKNMREKAKSEQDSPSHMRQGSAESSEPEYTNHPSDTQTSESEEDFHRLQG